MKEFTSKFKTLHENLVEELEKTRKQIIELEEERDQVLTQYENDTELIGRRMIFSDDFNPLRDISVGRSKTIYLQYVNSMIEHLKANRVEDRDRYDSQIDQLRSSESILASLVKYVEQTRELYPEHFEDEVNFHISDNYNEYIEKLIADREETE